MLEAIRPYEMSVWTLQDGFLAALRVLGVEVKGQIDEPEIDLKIDGTSELHFRIPMYYYDKNERVENPFWYDVKNGLIIQGLRKIKVIFNKGNKELEKVYEFLITEVEETHENGELYCSVTGSGLPFEELGKRGYKISLSEDSYYNEYNEFCDNVLEEAEENDWTAEQVQDALKEAPINNLQYWADKIFENSGWEYEVAMDWYLVDGMVITYPTNPTNALAGYAIVGQAKVGDSNGNFVQKSYLDLTDDEKDTINNVRESKGYRRNDRVYEDAYVTSWINVNDQLIPNAKENAREKYRLFSGENSNIYNLSQELAETFGVYCRYEFEYDDNYHIIGRKAIFYNSFFEEEKGQIDINYPYDTSNVSRTIDSNDVYTKLYVNAVDDDTTLSGKLTIMTTEANKSREDYILNFDYLHDIGAISEEQYAAIEPYEAKMFVVNTRLEELSEQINGLEQEYEEYRATATISSNSILIDNEIINQATELVKNVAGNDEIITIPPTPDLAERGVLLQQEGEEGKYRIKLSPKQGILYGQYPPNNENTPFYTIRVFTDCKNATLCDEYTITYENNIEKDDSGNIIAIKNIVPPTDRRIYYLSYSYRPVLYTEKVVETYTKKLEDDNAAYKNAVDNMEAIDALLEELQEEYDTLLEKKEKAVAKFNIMMGPALREGNWTPEDYNNYGSRYYEEAAFTTDGEPVEPEGGSGKMRLIYDEEAFKGEQLNYYEEGTQTERHYYPFVKLARFLDNDLLQENLGRFSFTFEDNNTTHSAIVVDSDGNPTREDELAQTWNFIIGAEAQFAMLSETTTVNDVTTTTVFPALLLTGFEHNSSELESSINNPRFRVGYTLISEEDLYLANKTNVTPTDLGLQEIEITSADIVNSVNAANYTIVYPRIEFNSLSLKTSEDKLDVQMFNTDGSNLVALEPYTDYSILLRQETQSENANLTRIDAYYITPHLDQLFSNGTYLKKFLVEYEISNADLNIYLDALQVSKTNAYPKVSYSLDVAITNKAKNFIQDAYNKLGRIVYINDHDLKFNNVRGYISGLTLSLDMPWEDSIEIQNYKNKFEDLFSKIVASSEALQANENIYNKAASAFGSNGVLRASNMQSLLDQGQLQYNFLNNKLSITENDGIIGINDNGAIAVTNEGFFTATTQKEDGSWDWSGAITPKGINATQIVTGQLDTNLIRIYSGDNLRFQMNDSGLYAYRTRSDGEYDPLQYVVHNSEGLFLTNKAGAVVNNYKVNTDTNRVAITWDGITIRNLQNQKVFYADDRGNLTLAGTISAKDGSVGGWTIGKNYLVSNNSIYGQAGMANKHVLGINDISSNSDIYKIFWAQGNDGNFYVDSNGKLNADSIVAKTIVVDDIAIGSIPSLWDELTKLIDDIPDMSVTPLNGNMFTQGEDGMIGLTELEFVLSMRPDIPFNTSNLHFYWDTVEEELETDITTEDENEGSSNGNEAQNGGQNNQNDEPESSEFTSQVNYLEFSEHKLTFSISYSLMQHTSPVPYNGSLYITVEYTYTVEEDGQQIEKTCYTNFYLSAALSVEGSMSVVIEADTGDKFNDNDVSNTLKCRCFNNVLGELDATGTTYTYAWYKLTDMGSMDSEWASSKTGEKIWWKDGNYVITSANEIDINDDEFVDKGVFRCEVREKEEEPPTNNSTPNENEQQGSGD